MITNLILIVRASCTFIDHLPLLIHAVHSAFHSLFAAISSDFTFGYLSASYCVLFVASHSQPWRCSLRVEKF